MSNDTSGPEPLYTQVKAALIQRMATGALKAGDRLPSEFALAAELGVSQGTVRRALDEMTAANLLTRRQGKGTFVASHTPHRALFQFFHLLDMQGRRQLPDSRVLVITSRVAKRAESDLLALPARSRLIDIERVRNLSGKPAIAETVLVPAALFPGLNKVPPADLPNTLYRFYEERWGVTEQQARENLTAVNATREDAKVLGIKPGTALLRIERLALSVEGKPLELRISRCLTADHYYEALLG